MEDKFKLLDSDGNFNTTIDKLKSLWWETERKPKLAKSIDKIMEKDSENKEVFEIMKELLEGIKIKSMEDYIKEDIEEEDDG